jgi:chromosome segregation ATPase
MYRICVQASSGVVGVMDYRLDKLRQNLMKNTMKINIAAGFLILVNGTVCGAMPLPGKASNKAVSTDMMVADRRVEQADAQVNTCNDQLKNCKRQVEASKALLKAAEADLRAAKADREALGLREEAQGMAKTSGLKPLVADPVGSNKPLKTASAPPKEDKKTKASDTCNTRIDSVDFAAQDQNSPQRLPLR